jgi:hypothetical protein
MKPGYCPFTPVESGYGVDLFEDDNLLLLAADLRMDRALRPHPVSSVAFTYLGNTLQLDRSIERRHIYNSLVFRCDICSTAQIGMCFLILRIFDNSLGFLYLYVEQFVFFFFFVAWGGRGGM